MGIVTARIGEEQHAQLREDAKRNGRSVSEELRIRLAQSECTCNGSGIAFRHRGEWIYCACRAGLDAEMAHMAGQLQAIADDIQRMRIAGKETTQEYGDLIFEFERITAEHDDLERQWAEVLK